MNLDDELWAAADEVRRNVDGLSTPEFQPRTPKGPRVVATLAAIVVGVAGWFGATRLTADDGQGVDIVSPAATPTTASTTQPTTGERPDGETETAAPLSGVTDNAEYPISPMVKPGLEPTMEPDFGTSIQRITATEQGGVIIPAHPTTQAFNVDGSYFVLYEAGMGHLLFDGSDFSEIGQLDIDAVDIEDFYWDSVDPGTLHFVRSGTNELVALDVTTNQQTTAFVFDGCTAVDSGTRSGSTTSASPLIGLLCRDDEGNGALMAYNTASTTLTGPVDVAADAAPVAFASGEGFVLVSDDALTVYDSSLSPGSARQLYDAETTAITVGLDAEGRDILVATLFDDPDSNGLAVRFDLATGERSDIIGDTNGYGFPTPGSFVTTASAQGRFFLAVIQSVDNAGVLANEIVLLDLAEPSTVRRIGRHRMGEPSDLLAPWRGVSAAVSPDGSKVLFSSDWGTGESIDTYLIDLTRPADS